MEIRTGAVVLRQIGIKMIFATKYDKSLAKTAVIVYNNIIYVE